RQRPGIIGAIGVPVGIPRLRGACDSTGELIGTPKFVVPHRNGMSTVLLVSSKGKHILIELRGSGVYAVCARYSRINRSGKESLRVGQRGRIKQLQRYLIAGCAARLGLVRIGRDRTSRPVALEWGAQEAAGVVGVGRGAVGVIDRSLAGEIAVVHRRCRQQVECRAPLALAETLVAPKEEGSITPIVVGQPYRPADVEAKLVLLQRVDCR